MKSFTASSENEKKLQPGHVHENTVNGILTGHYELYKNIHHLQGCIVNCGIESCDYYTRFAILRNMLVPEGAKKAVIFEKHLKTLYFDSTVLPHGELYYKLEKTPFQQDFAGLSLQHNGTIVHDEFINGLPAETIPHYLIENPELKIAFLVINTDDYEAAMTALQFFYPRLEAGGVLVLDNYYKMEDDHKAVSDYFAYEEIEINNMEESPLCYVIKK